MFICEYLRVKRESHAHLRDHLCARARARQSYVTVCEQVSNNKSREIRAQPTAQIQHSNILTLLSTWRLYVSRRLIAPPEFTPQRDSHGEMREREYFADAFVEINACSLLVKLIYKRAYRRTGHIQQSHGYACQTIMNFRAKPLDPTPRPSTRLGENRGTAPAPAVHPYKLIGLSRQTKHYRDRGRVLSRRPDTSTTAEKPPYDRTI